MTPFSLIFFTDCANFCFIFLMWYWNCFILRCLWKRQVNLTTVSERMAVLGKRQSVDTRTSTEWPGKTLEPTSVPGMCVAMVVGSRSVSSVNFRFLPWSLIAPHTALKPWYMSPGIGIRIQRAWPLMCVKGQNSVVNQGRLCAAGKSWANSIFPESDKADHVARPHTHRKPGKQLMPLMEMEGSVGPTVNEGASQRLRVWLFKNKGRLATRGELAFPG